MAAKTTKTRVKRVRGTAPKAKTYFGYTETELVTMSVYELREISKLMEEEAGEEHFRYTHFFKKEELVTYITANKATKKEMRDTKSAKLNKSLAGTAQHARLARKHQMIKSLKIRLGVISKVKTRAKETSEVKAKIKAIEQEITSME